MTPPMFWVCYDHGQGGLWALVRASSAEQIRSHFPQLVVYETAPTILNEADKARISKSGAQDLAAPTGWLADLVPPPAQAIASVAEFQRLLKFVQRQLRDGVLRQCSTGSPGLPPVSILHLPINGPWPDVIEADFVDARGQPYHLFVDCYHGAGVWHDSSSVEPHRSQTKPMLNSNGENPADWKFEVREVSAGVYRATGVDRTGRRVVVEGVDPDTCLEECRSAAVMILQGRQDLSSSPAGD